MCDGDQKAHNSNYKLGDIMFSMMAIINHCICDSGLE